MVKESNDGKINKVSAMILREVIVELVKTATENMINQASGKKEVIKQLGYTGPGCNITVKTIFIGININEFYIQNKLSQFVVITTNILIEIPSQNDILLFCFGILKEGTDVLYKPFLRMSIRILIFHDTINMIVGEIQLFMLFI